MADKLSDEKLSELRELFSEIDTDGDGVITKADMKRAWGRLFSEDDLTHALKDVTTDKNGNIDFQRFLAAITAEGTSSLEIDFANDEEMAKVFRIADKDGDGFLSAKEVRNFLGGGSEIDGEIDLMIEEADLDSDGRIDFTEFFMIFTTQPAQGRV